MALSLPCPPPRARVPPAPLRCPATRRAAGYAARTCRRATRTSLPFTVTADRRLVYLKGLDYSNLWLVTGLGGPRGRMVTTRRLTSGTAQRRGRRTGRTEALGTLPFRDPSCVSAEAMAPGALVCSVPERVSDVWMVEGFDPEVR